MDTVNNSEIDNNNNNNDNNKYLTTLKFMSNIDKWAEFIDQNIVTFRVLYDIQL